MEATKDIPQSQGENILLVEDDPMFREMSLLMLQHLGYSVFPAATPNEAIRIVQESSNEIQLFITDFVMPEMNGHALAERLLEIRPGIKRLFMSGHTFDEIAEDGVLDVGASFLHKPFSLKDLGNKIREALD